MLKQYNQNNHVTMTSKVVIKNPKGYPTHLTLLLECTLNHNKKVKTNLYKCTSNLVSTEKIATSYNKKDSIRILA